MEETKLIQAYQQMSKNVKQDKFEILQSAMQNVSDDKIDKVMSCPTKSPKKVLLLSIFLGLFGVGRFYLGDKKIGIIKLLLSAISIGMMILSIGLFVILTVLGAISETITAGLIFLYIVMYLGFALFLGAVVYWFEDVFFAYRKCQQKNFDAYYNILIK